MSTKKLQILGSFGSGSSVELDTTLTQSGMAADAKVTGDRISNLATQINNIDTLVGDKSVATQISTAIENKSDVGHAHDDKYYTESEIDTKLSGKANSSHGNHVPATETANNAKFLRNDNTWQTVTPANIGALSTSGGTINGKLTIKEYENGYGRIWKNHSDTADYGFTIRDYDKNGKNVGLTLNGSGNTIMFLDNAGATYSILTAKTAVTIAQGGTGATDAATARSNLGITPANIGAATTAQYNSLSTLVGDKAVSTQISDYAPSKTGSGASGNWGINITGSSASCTGNAATATTLSSTLAIAKGGTGLTASPSMLINLATTTAANVLQASPRPGVTGTLPIANGGTGLTASPSMLVNLGSTSAANVLAASPRPGITGTLGIANGGTGATSKSGARTNIGITSGTTLPSSASAGDIFFLYS